MSNYVSLKELIKLRFSHMQISITKLQRWCREKVLPARKLGGEWWVDLDEFDKPPQNDLDPLTAEIMSNLIGQN